MPVAVEAQGWHTDCMNNAREIREVFERVHGITRPKHTDVIHAMVIQRRRGVSPEIAVTYALAGHTR